MDGVVKRVVLAAALCFSLLPREARAHSSCVEQSDVTGDKVCGRYGDRWSTERTFPLVISAGFWSGHVVPAGHSWNANLGKDNPKKFGVSGNALGMRAIDDVGFDFRMHGFATKSFYIGLDWAFAFGAVKPNLEPRTDYELRDKGGLNWIHARLATVLGGRVPLGPFSARLEALVGVQIASLTLEGRRPGGEWVKGSVTAVGLLLEPRLAVDVWTSPWSTISVWGGGNVLFPADRTMGLSFALHGRAFDGHY